MLLLDDNDELPTIPRLDELNFAASIGVTGIGAVEQRIVAGTEVGWLKAARVIVSALTAGGFPVSAAAVNFHARCLMVLVSTGALEAQGNLRKPRFSEVRIPASTMPNDRHADHKR